MSKTTTEIAHALQNLRSQIGENAFDLATDVIFWTEEDDHARADKALLQAEREIAKRLTVLVGCDRNDEARDLYRAAERAGLSLAGYPVSELIED